MTTALLCAIRVLDSTGDTALEWTPGDAEEERRVRELVWSMQDSGYTFFLVSGEPADAVSAGHGKLLVRKLEDPVTELAAEAEAASTISEEGAQGFLPPRRRGRKPKAPQAEAVGVRRMAGG